MVDRNQQVRAMGTIFSNAVRTVVCLELAHEASDMESMATFSHLLSLSPINHNFGGSAEIFDLSAVCRRLLPVTRSRYWTRTWIVQELLLSKDVQLLVRWPQPHLVHLDWSAFLRFLDHIRSHVRERQNLAMLSDPDPLRAIPSEIWRVLRCRAAILCEEACRRLSKAIDLHFWHVIQAHAYTSCADVRDRLFALVDLVYISGPRGKLRIDYALTPERLLLEALLCLSGDTRVPAFQCAETLREMLHVQNQLVPVSCHAVIDLRRQHEPSNFDDLSSGTQAELLQSKKALLHPTGFGEDYSSSTHATTFDWVTTSELSACAFENGRVVLCDPDTARCSIGAFSALGASIPYLREAGMVADKIDVVMYVSACNVELQWRLWKSRYPYKRPPMRAESVLKPQANCSHRHAFGLRQGVTGFGLPRTDMVEATIKYRQSTESKVAATSDHDDDPQVAFFASQQNIGVVCSGARVGDVICGCSSVGAHLVLRPTHGDRVFEVVGRATRINMHSREVVPGSYYVSLFIGKIKGVLVKHSANLWQYV
ncbi:hypothetical protein LTR17_016743 [Elasticomyces elasticus]|nr:hypothetical protein LTR17_016743 [Elasticomyces elasticus]